MARILTITMNPAIDVSTSVARVTPIQKLRCTVARRDPGGGGINIARVASRLGADVAALYPIGGSVGQLLQRLVEGEKVRSIPIPVQEETREDITVLETLTRDQFRFVLAGPQLSPTEWRACLEAFRSYRPRPGFVAASGSLPPGVPEDFYARIAEIARGWMVPFALDSSGAPLKAAMEHGVDLAKPNLRELRELTGKPLVDELAWLEACDSLVASGKARTVALTLGHRGALLVARDRAWRARALPIKPVSTVGAGDGFLGAMIWALAAGQDLEEAFRYGIAGGSATLLASGTELCHAQQVHDLLERVVIEPVDSAALEEARGRRREPIA